MIEPLESVSLSILPTTRKTLADAGTPEEVAQALTQKSASATTQVGVVSASQARTPAPLQSGGAPSHHRPDTQRKDDAGNVYYSFEFTSKARGIVRHAITTLAVVNGACTESCYTCPALTPPDAAGKVFTLTTGSSERRWSKMAERLKMVSDSFSLAGY